MAIKGRAVKSYHPMNAGGGAPQLYLGRDSIVNSGGVVPTWGNKVGSGGGVPDFTQATPGDRPDYNATGLDSRPCIEFDGITQYLHSSGVSYPTMLGHVFVRAAIDSDPGGKNGGLFCMSDNGFQDWDSINGIAIADSNTIGAFEAIRFVDSGGNPAFNFARVLSQSDTYELRMAGITGGAELWVSGVSKGTDGIAEDSGINNTDRVAIGIRVGSGSFLSPLECRVSDIITFTFPLSVVGRKMLRGFINNQAGK